MMTELEAPEFKPIDLMERHYANLHVILYWLRTTNTCYITVVDEHTGKSSYADVPNDKAMDAFKHPFVYIK